MIISTSGSGHDDEIAWAIPKDGMEVGMVFGFQAACAWIARRIAPLTTVFPTHPQPALSFLSEC